MSYQTVYKIYNPNEVPDIDNINPANVLPPTALDQSSGYMHLCLHEQILLVLNRFYKHKTSVKILKIPVQNLDDTKLKLEEVIEEGNTRFFPHYYGDIQFRHVDEVLNLLKGEQDQWKME